MWLYDPTVMLVDCAVIGPYPYMELSEADTLFGPCPICQHHAGRVYDLYRSQPPGGRPDFSVFASLWLPSEKMSQSQLRTVGLCQTVQLRLTLAVSGSVSSSLSASSRVPVGLIPTERSSTHLLMSAAPHLKDGFVKHRQERDDTRPELARLPVWSHCVVCSCSQCRMQPWCSAG